MTVAVRRRRGSDLDAATLYALLALRMEVFVVEQSCPYLELDGRDLDPTTRHYWLESDGAEVISTLRLLEECSEDTAVFRIGRVCTRADRRGHGHSGRLMEAALSEVGDRTCRLSAQTYLTGMYARRGFRPDGPEFLDDGIAHVPMVREASR